MINRSEAQVRRASSRWKAIALWAVCAVLLAACGGDGSAEETTTTAASAPETTAPDNQETTTTTEASTESTTAPAADVYEDGDTVTIMVPYSAGGGFDTLSRLVAPALEERLSEMTGKSLTVVVENVTGGGGQVGIETAFRSDPDGLTFAIGSLDIMVGQQVADDAGFDVSEMEFLGQIASDSRALMIRPGVVDEGATFQDLVERSQETPILWGSSGVEYPTRLIFSILSENGYDIAVDRVEFDGTSDAVASMLREELEVYFVTTPSAVEAVEANPELSIFAVFAAETDPLTPDTPTLASQGVEGAEELSVAAGYSKRVFFAPPETDPAALEILRQAMNDVLTDADFVSQAEQAGYVINYETPDDVATLAEETLALYSDNVDVLTAD